MTEIVREVDAAVAAARAGNAAPPTSIIRRVSARGVSTAAASGSLPLPPSGPVGNDSTLGAGIQSQSPRMKSLAATLTSPRGEPSGMARTVLYRDIVPKSQRSFASTSTSGDGDAPDGASAGAQERDAPNGGGFLGREKVDAGNTGSSNGEVFAPGSSSEESSDDDSPGFLDGVSGSALTEETASIGMNSFKPAALPSTGGKGTDHGSVLRQLLVDGLDIGGQERGGGGVQIGESSLPSRPAHGLAADSSNFKGAEQNKTESAHRETKQRAGLPARSQRLRKDGALAGGVPGSALGALLRPRRSRKQEAFDRERSGGYDSRSSGDGGSPSTATSTSPGKSPLVRAGLSPARRSPAPRSPIAHAFATASCAMDERREALGSGSSLLHLLSRNTLQSHSPTTGKANANASTAGDADQRQQHHPHRCPERVQQHQQPASSSYMALKSRVSTKLHDNTLGGGSGVTGPTEDGVSSSTPASEISALGLQSLSPAAASLRSAPASAAPGATSSARNTPRTATPGRTPGSGPRPRPTFALNKLSLNKT